MKTVKIEDIPLTYQSDKDIELTVPLQQEVQREINPPPNVPKEYPREKETGRAEFPYFPVFTDPKTGESRVYVDGKPFEGDLLTLAKTFDIDLFNVEESFDLSQGEPELMDAIDGIGERDPKKALEYIAPEVLKNLGGDMDKAKELFGERSIYAHLYDGETGEILSFSALQDAKNLLSNQKPTSDFNLFQGFDSNRHLPTGKSDNGWGQGR